MLAADRQAVTHTRDARGNIVIQVHRPFPPGIAGSEITLLLDTEDPRVARVAGRVLESRFRTRLEDSPYNDQLAGELAETLHVVRFENPDNPRGNLTAPHVRLYRNAPYTPGNGFTQTAGIFATVRARQAPHYYLRVGRIPAELRGVDTGVTCRIEDSAGHRVAITHPTLEIVVGRLQAFTTPHRHGRARINRQTDRYAATLQAIGMGDMVRDADASAAMIIKDVRRAYSLRPDIALAELFQPIAPGLNRNQQVKRLASRAVGGTLRKAQLLTYNVGWPLQVVGITKDPASHEYKPPEE